MNTNNEKTFAINIDIYAIINRFQSPVEKDERIDNLIDEILNLCTHIQIKKISDNDVLDSIVDSERKSLLSKPIIMKFSLEISGEHPEFDNTELSLELTKGLYKAEIANLNVNNIFQEVMDIFTSANILMPGLLLINKIYIFANNELLRLLTMVDFVGIIQMFSFKADKNLYKKEITLEKAVLWLKNLPKDNKKYSKSPVGVAIASLNQLLYSDMNKYTATIWALIAIEALYCRETSSQLALQSQIYEKARTLFTSQIVDELKDMYNHRSKLLHGTLNIPIYPQIASISIMINRKDKESNDLEKYFHYSLNLLFSTLQKLLTNSKHELEFERIYKLKE